MNTSCRDFLGLGMGQVPKKRRGQAGSGRHLRRGV